MTELYWYDARQLKATQSPNGPYRRLPHDDAGRCVVGGGCVRRTRVFRPSIIWSAVLLVAVTTTALIRAQYIPPPRTAAPGTMSDGSTLLPNGWRLGPVGKHLPLSTLPLNAVVSPDGRHAVITNNGLAKPSLNVVDINAWTIKTTTPVDHTWLGLAFHPDGTKLYASGAGPHTVPEFTYADGVVTRVRTFALPAYTGDTMVGGLAVSPNGRALFATRVFAMTISRIDLTTGQGTHSASLPAEPYSCALSPDGRTLIAANADNNAVAVVDVSNPALSFVEGFIPTGWYPTSAVFTKDGKQILILNGKGLTPAPNMTNSGMERRMLGAVSLVATPDRVTLADYTRRVMSLSPYSDTIRLNPNVPIGSPIPRTVRGASPIKHVFYVIRENRTYDQVLGDLTEGNSDPKLTIFGRDITPNAHALSQNFVLFDNFFVDADVSYNGHSYSTAAYATDVVEKLWHATYARGGNPYPF